MGRRTFTVMLTLAAAGSAGLLAVAVPATAAARHPAGAHPAVTAPAASHPAIAGYADTQGGAGNQYDSAGGTVSWTSVSTGLEKVTFGKLAAIANKGGNFEVSVMELRDTCAVQDWAASGSALQVFVACYDYSGNPESSDFTLAVTRATSAPHGSVFNYAWVSFPAKSYRLTGKYVFNSAHGKSTVRHLGTGRYVVAFGGPKPATSTGTVKVTADGDEGGDCQLLKWLGTSHGVSAYVDCYASGGSRQNRSFLIAYARNTSILGRAGLTAANARADHATKALYQPAVQYDSHKGARVTALTLNKGEYVSLFTGSQGPHPASHTGDVQVTTLGAHYLHCFIEDWEQGVLPFADVECVSNSGNLVFGQYAVQWTVG